MMDWIDAKRAREVFDFIILPSVLADRGKIEIWENFVENQLFKGEVSRWNIFKKMKRITIFRREEEYLKELREKVRPGFDRLLVKHELLTILRNFRRIGNIYGTWRRICSTIKTTHEIGKWRDYLRLWFPPALDLLYNQDYPALEQYSTTIGAAADVRNLLQMWESMCTDLSWDHEEIQSRKYELVHIFESDLMVVGQTIVESDHRLPSESQLWLTSRQLTNRSRHLFVSSGASEEVKLLETWKSICGAIKTEQEMGIWQEYLNDWFLEDVPTFGQDIRAQAQKLKNMWDNMIIDLNWNDEEIESHKLAQRPEFVSVLSHVKESIIPVNNESILTNQFRGPFVESNMEANIEELRNTRNMICATLKDAEEKEFWKESVKFWLRELRGLAFEAEDILSIYDYNQLQGRIEGKYDHMEAQQYYVVGKLSFPFPDSNNILHK